MPAARSPTRWSRTASGRLRPMQAEAPGYGFSPTVPAAASPTSSARSRARSTRRGLRRSVRAALAGSRAPGGRRGLAGPRSRAPRRGAHGPPGSTAGGEVEAVDQGSDVQPGAAHEDRQRPAARDFGDERPRSLGPVGDGERLVGLDEVDEMMRNRASLCEADLRRPDIHPPVHPASQPRGPRSGARQRGRATNRSCRWPWVPPRRPAEPAAIGAEWPGVPSAHSLRRHRSVAGTADLQVHELGQRKRRLEEVEGEWR